MNEHSPQDSRSTTPFRYSVIIPTFNRADIIGQALKSVFSYGPTNEVEIVIIDDCSTDGTSSLIDRIRAENPNSCIRYIRLERQAGVTGAKNAGIEQATGSYLIFLDSDNELTEGVFERARKVFEEHPTVAVYFGTVCNKSGRPLPSAPGFLDRPLTYEEYFRGARAGECLPICRHEVLQKHTLRFVSELKGFEAILYARILKLGYTLYRDSSVALSYDDLRDDRICHSSNLIRDSERLARGMDFFFNEFGDDYRRIDSRSYRRDLLKLSLYSKLAGISTSQKFHGDFAVSLLQKIPEVFLQSFYRWYRRVYP